MSGLCKSMVLGGALSTAVAIAANADPLYRDGVGSFRPPGPQITALPPANPARAPDRLTPQPGPSIPAPQELSASHDAAYAGWNPSPPATPFQ